MFIASFLLSFVRSGGFLAAAGQARDVAGHDAGRDEVPGDLPGGAVRLVSQAAAAMDQAAYGRCEPASHQRCDCPPARRAMTR
jgi:hypothetical protein